MLPIATEKDLGAIRIGAGLQSAIDGTLSVADAAVSFCTYFRGTFSGLANGLDGNSTASSLVDWPLTGCVTFPAGTDSASKAALATSPTESSITFFLCLNDNKLGSVMFVQGQTNGVIAWDTSTTMKIGDVLTLTTPHPPVSSSEKAKNLLAILTAQPE